MFLEGAGASGKLSSSVVRIDIVPDDPHNCRTADTNAGLSADGSTAIRLA